MIREAVREIHKYIARPSNAAIRPRARSHPSAHATRCTRTNVNSRALTKRGNRVFFFFFFFPQAHQCTLVRKSRHFLSKSQQRQPHLLLNSAIFSRCDRAVLNTCKTEGGRKKRRTHYPGTMRHVSRPLHRKVLHTLCRSLCTTFLTFKLGGGSSPSQLQFMITNTIRP